MIEISAQSRFQFPARCLFSIIQRDCLSQRLTAADTLTQHVRDISWSINRPYKDSPLIIATPNFDNFQIFFLVCRLPFLFSIFLARPHTRLHEETEELPHYRTKTSAIHINILGDKRATEKNLHFLDDWTEFNCRSQLLTASRAAAFYLWRWPDFTAKSLFFVIQLVLQRLFKSIRAST